MRFIAWVQTCPWNDGLAELPNGFWGVGEQNDTLLMLPWLWFLFVFSRCKAIVMLRVHCSALPMMKWRKRCDLSVNWWWSSSENGVDWVSHSTNRPTTQTHFLKNCTQCFLSLVMFSSSSWGTGRVITSRLRAESAVALEAVLNDGWSFAWM